MKKNSLVNNAFLIVLLLVSFSIFGETTDTLIKHYWLKQERSYSFNSGKITKIALVLSTILGGHVKALDCNVCRNGGEITNPENEFTMTNSAGEETTWTCGFLQESMADVKATGGAPGEARWCALGQLWADKECSCSGDPVPTQPPKDPNPSCDLCKSLSGQEAYDFNYVPVELEEELVETEFFGRIPCGGLYLALAEGVISNDICPILREKVGKLCCNAPFLDKGDNEEYSCGKLHANCSSQACCSAFTCKSRFLGRDPICSSKSKGRTRLGSGFGGAGGRQRHQEN
ncbi:MAG: hypothetical protein AB8G05_06835 [Oligoflexales bacterium]